MDPLLSGKVITLWPWAVKPKTNPEQMRWSLDLPEQPTDFIDGLMSVAAHGDGMGQTRRRSPFHCNHPMAGEVVNADGEMLILPQEGSLFVKTGVDS